MNQPTNKSSYEKDLIKKVLKNDRSAQAELFNCYAPKMMSVCKRYARDSHEANDFLQEGFIRVFKNLRQFKFKGSFEGWIKKIIINVILRSKSKSVKFKLHEYEAYNNYDKVSPDILDHISNNELIEIINQLPQGYKLIFNLYVIEGYTHKEIAKMLGIKESTSRSQLTRAKIALQRTVLHLFKTPSTVHG